MTINNERDHNSQVLLKSKKLHLVLDLDHTLVHSMSVEKLDEQDKTYVRNNARNNSDDGMYLIGSTKAVKMRPGVREFLKEVSTMYDVSLYTMGNREYANIMLNILNTYSKTCRIKKALCREDCTRQKRKGLGVVMFRKEMVLVVDDMREVWVESDRGNVITIRPYYYFGSKFKKFDRYDIELARVLGVLREVHSRFFNDFEGFELEGRNVSQVLQGVYYYDKSTKAISEENKEGEHETTSMV